MKALGLSTVWVVMVIPALLIGSFVGTVDSHAADVCFPEAQAGQILTQLEKTKNLEEQVILLEKANGELEYQVKLLREIGTIQKEQVQQYKDLMQIQKDGYEGIIKASKPSAIKQLFDKAGWLGIGALIGMALLL